MLIFLTEVTPEYNPDDVTPGFVGFLFTGLFALAVILIGMDLYRRVRRMRYREDVRAEIAQELESTEQKTAESDTEKDSD